MGTHIRRRRSDRFRPHHTILPRPLASSFCAQARCQSTFKCQPDHRHRRPRKHTCRSVGNAAPHTCEPRHPAHLPRALGRPRFRMYEQGAASGNGGTVLHTLPVNFIRQIRQIRPVRPVTTPIEFGQLHHLAACRQRCFLPALSGALRPRRLFASGEGKPGETHGRDGISRRDQADGTLFPLSRGFYSDHRA